MRYADLTSKQKRLYDEIEQRGGYSGEDLRDVLTAIEAEARDKAAVAEVFGGDGAGAEFRREHISKRSQCQHCRNGIEYLDGIRDPYWVHTDLIGPGHPALTPIVPNDAHTRLVFEKTRR